MQYHQTIIDDFERICAEKIEPILGKKEARQFREGVHRDSCELISRIIDPALYQPASGIYIPISDRKNTPGRNHITAQRISHSSVRDYQVQCLFTNPLTITKPDKDGKWSAPKDRVALGDHAVFTFEFDDDDPMFLKTQLGWLRHRTSELDSPIGELFKACRQWVDFTGLTVNYSGGKSLHIHITFRTDHARANLNLDAATSLRYGLIRQWHRLKPLVMDALKPGIEPDASLEQPDHYRRLPMGSREIDKPHPLGIELGQMVPQVLLWERFIDRAPKAATVSFFDPTDFFFAGAQTRARTSGKYVPTTLDFSEIQFCAAKLEAIYPGEDGHIWPKFHSLTLSPSGDWMAYFTNSLNDMTPASVMRQDYSRVKLAGRDAHTVFDAPTLPLTLGEMLGEWVAEYQSLNDRGRTPEEADFANTARDTATAKASIGRILAKTIRTNRQSFVCAPEGVSKTSSLFENHHRTVQWLASAGECSRVMYAFADYAAVEAKAAEFESHQAKNGYVAIILPSFERAYKDACTTLGLQPLTLFDAVQMKAPNLWAAIEKRQPKVLEEFTRRHAEMMVAIGDRTPAFFVVHQVAHHWAVSSPTRLMWAPSFWEGERREEHTALCRQETAVGLLIHDEVKVASLIASRPRALVEWVEAMATAHAGVWYARAADATALYESFNQYIGTNNVPLVDGKPYLIKFDEARDIFTFGFTANWQDITTSDNGEYGPSSGPYGARSGREWKVATREWPMASAGRTVVLTTELVPTTVARASSIPWVIFDLDTPLIPRDRVEVHPAKGVRGASLLTLCEEWRAKNPNLFIVSNKVASLDETMTHASARGSNDLMGKEILQTMTFVTPDEFEELEALNAWTGRGDLIRLRHIDEFNQTAGRNLGFRKRPGAKHDLLVHNQLFELLIGPPMARCRYKMEVVANRNTRRKATTKGVQRSATPLDTLTSKERMAVLRAALNG